jgi:hypothetical protein
MYLADIFINLKAVSAIEWKKDHTCESKRYLDNRIMSYVTTFCEVTIFEINLCYCPINDEYNKYRGELGQQWAYRVDTSGEN